MTLGPPDYPYVVADDLVFDFLIEPSAVLWFAACGLPFVEIERAQGGVSLPVKFAQGRCE